MKNSLHRRFQALALSMLTCISLVSAGSLAVHAETPPLPPELMPAAAEKEGTPASPPTEQPMILLDFYSAYCGTCRMMDPYLKNLQAKTSGKIQFQRLDIGKPENEKYGKQYGIVGTPTYILFTAQGEPVYRMEQMITPVILERQLLRFAGKLQSVDLTTLPVTPLESSTEPLPQPQRLEDMVLVSFENAKCKECKDMQPYLQGFEMAGQDGLQILHLDTDTPKGKNLMAQLRIKTLPTYVLFDNSKPNQSTHGELFRFSGNVEPRRLWDIIRLFGTSGV